MYEKNKDEAIFKLKYEFGEPWCKMVKRKIITDNFIQFSETKVHNDTKYSYLVGFHSTNVIVDRHAIYCVTDRKESVSKDCSTEKMFIRTKIFSEATVFFFHHGINIFGRFTFNPLGRFILKGDITNSKKCLKIMRSCGMSRLMIIKGMIIYALSGVFKFPLKVIENKYRY